MADDEGSSWGWVIFGLSLVGMFAVGGTFLAHWLWNTSWLLSALLAPVALVAVYVVLKIWVWID